MIQMDAAAAGTITEEMKTVAMDEGCSPESIREGVLKGSIVIPKNINRKFRARGIGKGLKTKVNANIGTSSDHFDLEEELEKLDVAVAAGADSVMDLSTGGDLALIRKKIVERSDVMLGAVPIYEVAAKLAAADKNIMDMTSDLLFDSIEEQCQQGVDYITVHCGVTQRSYAMAGHSNRIAGIVSRGGSLLAAWMHHHKRENPLYEEYDRLLEIAHKYDVTLSLGDGLRPGAIADASDSAQLEELIVIGELVRRARKKNVQAMVEGPGHVPLNQIEANILMQKQICDQAPFYVLGPLTTDSAPGYDHITAAIGGAIAAAAGADFLCYVTPAEHLCLPNVDDVRVGVISARIAAHSGDIAKGVKNAFLHDVQMSTHRKNLNWEGMFEHAIDPVMARQRRVQSEDKDKSVCTMCGKLCAVDLHNTICDNAKNA